VADPSQASLRVVGNSGALRGDAGQESAWRLTFVRQVTRNQTSRLMSEQQSGKFPCSPGYQSCVESGCSSVGRASASQAECREFESHQPLHFFLFAPKHNVLSSNHISRSVLSCPLLSVVMRVNYLRLMKVPKEARASVGTVNRPSEMTVKGDQRLHGVGPDTGGQSIRRLQEDGRELLWCAHGMGDWSAMFVLARRILDGDGFVQDVEWGLELLREAADAGDPDALKWWMEDPAHPLLPGGGPRQDLAEGRKWLIRAGATGDANSRQVLAERILEGKGFARDLAEGRRRLIEAAEAGSPKAMSDLAMRILTAQGFDRDVREGRRWLTKAAQAGYPPAMGELAQRIFNPQGEELFERMSAEGSAWYSKAQEVHLRGFDRVQNAGASHRLGEQILGGDGIGRDVDKGMQWVLQQAEAGVPSVMCVLALRFLIRASAKGRIGPARFPRRVIRAFHPKTLCRTLFQRGMFMLTTRRLLDDEPLDV
jgi:TPR repeat protein